MGSVNGEDAIDASGKAASPDRIILVVCPTHRDYRELPRISPPGIEYIFHDYASTSLEDLVSNPDRAKDLAADPLDEIEAILAKVRGRNIAGVISSDDYPGAALAAAVAQRLGLPAPDPAVALLCQHKYLARVEQAKHVPHAVPSFALIDVADETALPDGLRFPLFVKPVKSFFSIGAARVNSPPNSRRSCPTGTISINSSSRSNACSSTTPAQPSAPSGSSPRGCSRASRSPSKAMCMAASPRSSAWWTRSCSPARSLSRASTIRRILPHGVQARMGEIAATTMQGLGFDNGIFNIEMMYDAEADRISIIEINPRMASQFADLYEKVDGTNSFSVLLDIAQGRTAALHAPAGTLRICRELRVAQFRGLIWSRPCRARPISSASRESIRISGSSCTPRPVASCPTNFRMERAIATASSIWADATLPTCWSNSKSCRARARHRASADRSAARAPRADAPGASRCTRRIDEGGGERPPSAA